MSLSEPEASHQSHTETFLTPMKDNFPTDTEDLYPVIGKKTMIINELEHYPL
jgi:hypothetical protein